MNTDWQTDIRREGGMSKGKEPRSSIKVSKRAFRGKGGENTKTLRRLAWKQPSFKERVTAHSTSDFAPKIHRGQNAPPKLRAQR